MRQIFRINFLFALLLFFLFGCENKELHQDRIFVDLLAQIVQSENEAASISEIGTIPKRDTISCICINFTPYSLRKEEWDLVNKYWENANGAPFVYTDSLGMRTISWGNQGGIGIVSIDECIVKKNFKGCTSVNMSKAYIDSQKGVGIIRFKAMNHPLNGYEAIAILKIDGEQWVISDYIETAVY